MRFLLVISSKLSPISHRFGDIATQRSKICVFSPLYAPLVSFNGLAQIDLEEGEYLENKLFLCYYYNGAQWYEQFLQVSQPYRALILLDVAVFQAPLCFRSSWIHLGSIKLFLMYQFFLPLGELSLVGLAIDVVD